MKLTRCACLVSVRKETLLLVRVRQNQHWYLPGGKIEAGEHAEETLRRELAEELGIAIKPATVRPLYIVRGPAYGQPGEVELVCFSAEWTGDPAPQGEITAVDWIDVREREKLAPAVQLLCDKFLRT
jgi:8-oxo-dGTP diphosphatase